MASSGRLDEDVGMPKWAKRLPGVPILKLASRVVANLMSKQTVHRHPIVWLEPLIDFNGSNKRKRRRGYERVGESECKSSKIPRKADGQVGEGTGKSSQSVANFLSKQRKRRGSYGRVGEGEYKSSKIPRKAEGQVGQCLCSNDECLRSNDQCLCSNDQCLCSNDKCLCSNDQILSSSDQCLCWSERVPERPLPHTSGPTKPRVLTMLF